MPLLEISLMKWEIEQDWGDHGIGPRDAMRAGWVKDVGDVEFINNSYKDPSNYAFLWWYTTVCGKIVADMKKRCMASG